MTAYGQRLTDTQLMGWLHGYLAREPQARQVAALRALRAEGYGCDDTRWSRLWNRRDMGYVAVLRWSARVMGRYPEHAGDLGQLVTQWWQARRELDAMTIGRFGTACHREVATVRLTERTEALRFAGRLLGDPGLLGDLVATVAEAR